MDELSRKILNNFEKQAKKNGRRYYVFFIVITALYLVHKPLISLPNIMLQRWEFCLDNGWSDIHNSALLDDTHLLYFIDNI